MDRITNAPAEKAKSILIALCSADGALRGRVTKYLDQMDALDASSAPASSEQHGTKRKAEAAIKVCVQCQEPFYEEDNSEEACRYHSGYLEPNWDGEEDFWADHDENCHGKIDTEEMRIEFPEGFVWDCCEKLGSRPGCTKGRHTATGSHRGRYGTESSTGVGVGTDEDDRGGSGRSEGGSGPQDNK